MGINIESDSEERGLKATRLEACPRRRSGGEGGRLAAGCIELPLCPT